MVRYSDLRMVCPRAFGRGRDGKGVRLIVVHYTAGSERSTSAEDGAAYDSRRADGVSTHYFVDQNSVVQCVDTDDRANAAMHRGNRLGIQYELCGTVQTRQQWLDPASYSTLENAARQIARDCRRYDIPARRLTVAETRRAWTEYPDGPRGIVGHHDVTRAYPEDQGTHTDPGEQFPWDVLLQLIKDQLDQGDDVAFSDDEIELTEKAGAELYRQARPAGTKVSAASVLQLAAILSRRAWKAGQSADGRLADLTADVAGLHTAVTDLTAAVDSLRQAIAGRQT